MVLICSSDPQHRHYHEALRHLLSIRLSPEVYVPSVILLELDLELRSMQIPSNDRARIFNDFMLIIPIQKMLPTTPSIHARVANLENMGQARGGYFDTLIASTALEYNAEVISTDKAFSQMGVSSTW